MNRLVTLIDDVVLLVLLTMSVPFVILILGTPLTLFIRLVLEILRSIF